MCCAADSLVSPVCRVASGFHQGRKKNSSRGIAVSVVARPTTAPKPQSQRDKRYVRDLEAAKHLSLLPLFTRLRFSEVTVKSNDRVVSVFANMKEAHRVANVGVLDFTEMRFLAHGGDCHVAPGAK